MLWNLSQVMTKQDGYLVFNCNYGELCDVLGGKEKPKPKQTKEEVAAEYDAKVDNFLTKYTRRRKE